MGFRLQDLRVCVYFIKEVKILNIKSLLHQKITSGKTPQVKGFTEKHNSHGHDNRELSGTKERFVKLFKHLI